DDRESMWVDNNPASPYYGRMYISWNDFFYSPLPSLDVAYSNNGTTWTTVIIHLSSTTFHRNVQITGAPDGTGNVFIASMDEAYSGGNYYPAPRQNIMYRSTNGGVTWSNTLMGTPFVAPGDTLCFSGGAFSPIWRYQGWGQPGVGPGGVV